MNYSTECLTLISCASAELFFIIRKIYFHAHEVPLRSSWPESHFQFRISYLLCSIIAVNYAYAPLELQLTPV